MLIFVFECIVEPQYIFAWDGIFTFNRISMKFGRPILRNYVFRNSLMGIFYDLLLVNW